MKSEPVAGKPTALVAIEPRGPRTTAPREHSLTVTIQLSTADPRFADRHRVAQVLQEALAAAAPSGGETSGHTVDEILASTRAKDGTTSRVVTGIEGVSASRGLPSAAAVEAVRAMLAAEGYRVTIQETRECAETGCLVVATVDWRRRESVPAGWFSDAICGKHDYRACAQCNSLYKMTSDSSSVAAPSLHCTVCGAVMIEWGGSKTWSAELVPTVTSTKGE